MCLYSLYNYAMYMLYFAEGIDFSLNTIEVIFPMDTVPLQGVSDTTMNVLVTPTDDLLVEGTESYTLSIVVTSGTATVGMMDTVTVNITDNDGKSLV